MVCQFLYSTEGGLEPNKGLALPLFGCRFPCCEIDIGRLLIRFLTGIVFCLLEQFPNRNVQQPADGIQIVKFNAGGFIVDNFIEILVAHVHLLI